MTPPGERLQALEAKRRWTLLRFLSLGLLSLILVAFALFHLAFAPLWLFLSGLVLSLVPFAVGSFLAESFREEVRKALVRPVVEAQGFRYTPEGGLGLEELLWTGFLPPWPHHQTEDLVEGRMAGCPFRASRLVVSIPVSLMGAHILNRGTVYLFRLPRAYSGTLHLQDREWGTGMGMLLFSGAFFLLALLVLGRAWREERTLFFGALALLLAWGLMAWDRFRALKAKAPPLESFFRVYGKGPLDPSLAEALVGLRRALGRPFHLHLEGERLALFLQGETFRPSLLQPLPEWLAKAEARWKEEVSALGRFLETVVPVIQTPK